jgi:TP901 family phage tail tape measure protein
VPLNESSVLVRLRLLGGALFVGETRAATASLAGFRAESAATSGVLGGVRRRIGGAGAAIAGATRVIGGAAIVVGALGGEAVHMAANFGQAMEMVHTQAGETQKRTDLLGKSIINLSRGGRFAQGPTELANALYRLEGAGIRGGKALGALKAASDLAAVGNANVEDTAKTLAQTWFSGIKGASNFKNVVAELNATVGAGDLRLQQLVEALGVGILPVAKQSGLTFRDITGALALFGDETNNVSGWTAQLTTALHFITNPTTKATNALAKLGIGPNQLAKDMHKPRGLLTTLTDLHDHLAKLPGGFNGVRAEVAKGDILPGGRGRVLKVMLGQLDRYRTKLAQVGGTTKNWGEAVAKTNETTATRIHKAWGAIQATIITVGQKLEPVAAKALGGVAKGLNPKNFEALKSGFQTPDLGTAGFSGMRGVFAGIGVVAAKAWKQIKPLAVGLVTAFKPALPFFQNILLPLIEGIGVGIIGSVVFAIKALTIAIKIIAPVLGFLGKLAKPLKPVFFALGVAIGFIASGPILKLLEGFGKIGIVFKLLGVPIRIANALFRVLFRVVWMAAKAYVGLYVRVARFVGTLAGIVPRAIRAALNVVGGIIHVFETLPGKIGGAVGRAMGRLISRFGAFGKRVFAGAGKIGKAIVEGIVHAIKSMPGAIIGAVSSIVPKPIKKLMSKAGGLAGDVVGALNPFAAGGVTGKPLSLVGERGPEIVAAPQGSRVLTASQTRTSLRSGRTMAAGAPIILHNYVHLSGKQVHTEVVRIERAALEAS